MPAHVSENAAISERDVKSENPSTSGIPIMNWPVKENVVLSGISGRFPESENIQELKEHLFLGHNLITEDDRRFPPGLHGVPKGFAKLKTVNKFDAGFFGIPARISEWMDPQLRMLLEVSYEAIADAGINPLSLRGSKAAVYTACCNSDAEEAYGKNTDDTSGYTMLGCSKSMLSNRLSYFFGFNGPSLTVDTACSSSLVAFASAVNDIRSGEVDCALVCGTNLIFKTVLSLHMTNLSMLSPTCSCKAFDAAADGFARSETIAAVFLQKASNAKRIYGTVINAKTNTDGYKHDGITFPSGEVQSQLLREVYGECGVNPHDVVYSECHGTGTKAGDPQEVNAIDKVLCTNRKEPLLLGSIKSVLGHGEGAAGMAQLAKIVIAMEEGIIPANLHYYNPNPEIPALHEGRIKVVAEHTHWNGGLVGISSFGFGGSNAHLCLRSNPKPKSVPIQEGQKIFAFSGRTEEAVETILNSVQKTPDPEFIALLSDLMDSPPALNHYRGFTILNSGDATMEIEKVVPSDRPLWYVFSGVGTQWVGMGRDMMQLEVFRKSIEKSHELLMPHGLDLLDMIRNGTKETLDKILNSFTLIAAVQVALVDCLQALGLKPDGMIGHSVGELGCAYADGCLTAEQMVLAGYWRGFCVQNGGLPVGAMAAVGLSWEETAKRCPKGIVPACHNSNESVTVSGPPDAIKKFVEDLEHEEIFVKQVPSSGVGFHSYMVSKVAHALQGVLDKIIPSAKPRSRRWISTSVPEDQWHSPLAKMSSAAYHVNNLVSPVLFCQALQHVPSNAIVIEIAPHCLLQAILKRSLSADVVNLGLAHRGKADNYNHFLQTLGKLYNNGYNFQLSKLYRPVSFPVARGTPMISHLIKWDHSEDWKIPKYTDFGLDMPAGFSDFVYTYDVSDPSLKDYYLVDHAIDGRVIFPATGYLAMVWKSFAKIEKCTLEEKAIQFENITLQRATILPKEGSVSFNVTIMKATGEFEILESGNLVVSGNVFVAEGRPHEKLGSAIRKPSTDATAGKLEKKDIYKELRLRGYEYGPNFQGIIEADIDGLVGKLLWNGNWVSFLDTMLQFSILSKPFRHLCLPTRIPFLRINPAEHPVASDQTEVEIVYDGHLNACKAGGVQMMGVQCSATSRRRPEHDPILEEYKFVPHNESRVWCNAPEHETKLKEYNSACIHAVKQGLVELLQNKKDYIPNITILQKIANNLAATAGQTSIVNDETFNPSLLKFLKEIFTIPVDGNFKSKVGQLIDQFWQHGTSEDSLIASLHNNHALKSCLDLVVENTPSPLIHAVEIESSKSSIYKNVIGVFSSQVTTKLDYVLSDKLDVLVSAKAQEHSLKTVKWNVEQYKLKNTKAHLVVGNHVLFRARDRLGTCLHNIAESLQPGGFALFNDFCMENPVAQFLFALCGQKNGLRQDDLENAFKKCGLQIVCVKSDGILNNMYLVRKVDEMKDAVTLHVDSDSVDSWLEKLKEQCVEIQQKDEETNLYLISEKHPSSGIVGLVNCLRAEGFNRIRCIFNASTASHKTFSYDNVYATDLVMNVFRNDQWGSFRLHPIEKEAPLKAADHAYANVLVRGDLSSLTWFPSTLRVNDAHPEKKNLCHVYYAPLNFRDIMLATGKLPPEALPGDASFDDCLLGLEFAGRDVSGKRVMGLVSSQGLATTVLSDSEFLWDVPETWSLEEAATVPVVYTTAYYALLIRGKLQPGESVLIHSGSGGVGQAAISLALHMGCEVYVTVGSLEKRDYLKKIFPQLQDRNFANSRDLTFEYHILEETKGRGVDVVLNSLSEDKLQASSRCTAEHGRFLEIGKYDLSKNTALGMSFFLRNTTFHGILLDALFDTNNRERTILNNLLKEGIRSGVVRPLKRTVFESNQLEDAFRFMASGKHIGKVLIKIRDEEKSKAAKSTPISILTRPKVFCHPKKTYVLTGGLGGFGLELANWLIDHGARHLVLSSRSGIRTGYQARCVKQWKAKGINVNISTQDISTIQGAQKLLEVSGSQAPVGGIFHLAMVLKDSVLENQSVEEFNAVANPKVKGAHNLDVASRKVCQNLDYFVVFSSVVAGRGNSGQINYGYSNSAMERVCEKRQADGLPGLAIQWGSIGDVGVVHEFMGGNDAVVGGTIPQRLVSCLETMERFLTQNHPVMSSVVVAEKYRSEIGGDKKDVVASIARILGIKDPSKMSADITLADMGLDSLMGIEVKQTLERDFESNLTMQEIRQLTVAKLRELGESPSENTSAEPVSKSPAEVKPKIETKNLQRFDMNELISRKCVVALNQAKQGTPLFIVHPIEGNTKMLQTIAQGIDCPVYGIQCTRNTPSDSIEKMAAYYKQEVQHVQRQGPYHLAGYSFGATVALEMALQLEAQNPSDKSVVKNLILLDGCHQYVSAHTVGYSPNDSGAHADGLLVFVDMFLNVDIKKERQKLMKLSSWSDRLVHTVELLMSSKLFKDREDVATAVESFYKKLVAAHNYLCSTKVKGPVTLLRARKSAGAVEALGKDYALNKVCATDVKVHVVDGSHEDFIMEPHSANTAQIINAIVTGKSFKI